MTAGDLWIIKNKHHKIICKGPNYREPKTKNWRKNKESIVEGLENLNKGKLLYDEKDI